MGCVSSNLLAHEDEIAQLGSTALSHHIVKLTSTTYGLLNLDPPPHPSPTTPPTPPARFTLGSIFPTPLVEPKSLWSEPRPPLQRHEPEVINSWELMAGLDADSFRFSSVPQQTPIKQFTLKADKENSNPNIVASGISPNTLKAIKEKVLKTSLTKHPLDKFEKLCPPDGENKVVIYTTTLRGVRKTFEACNAVRSAIEGFGIMICERDVSMDRGFREELRELMKSKGTESMVLPRVFVKGRYLGGAEEVLRMVEEGCLGELLQGLPKKRAGGVCEGCGDVRFLPCFQCNGSCKMVIVVKENFEHRQGRTVTVKCPECNENGLVVCPICS